MKFVKFVMLIVIASPTNLQISAQTRQGNPDSSPLILLPREQEVELALSAGPEHLRSDATLYVFGVKGYEKIRSGKNGFTCMVNRDGNQAGDNDLKPTCWDPEGSATIVPIMLRVGELMAMRKTAKEIAADIDAGFNDGRFVSPRKSGIAYMLRGDVQYDRATKEIGKTLFPPHYMLYAPGVTNSDIGLSTDARRANPSLPFVYSGYSGGAHTAYIIVIAAEHKGPAH